MNYSEFLRMDYEQLGNRHNWSIEDIVEIISKGNLTHADVMGLLAERDRAISELARVREGAARLQEALVKRVNETHELDYRMTIINNSFEIAELREMIERMLPFFILMAGEEAKSELLKSIIDQANTALASVREPQNMPKPGGDGAGEGEK